MIQVRISGPLKEVCRGDSDVQINEEESLRDVLKHLDNLYPGIWSTLVRNQMLRRFVNVYVNGINVRGLDGLATPLNANSVVDLHVAVSGG